MDNVGSTNPTPKPNAPIPVEGEAAPPIRLAPAPAPAAGTPSVSRAPLNLGSGTGAAAPAAPSAAPRAPVLKPASPRPAAVPGGDRITTCKTFFTKLHPGALHFLEEQITNWLKDNPGVIIKRTDTVAGDITEKKAEPSLIILVWY
jgi:hypothetical protein